MKHTGATDVSTSVGVVRRCDHSNLRCLGPHDDSHQLRTGTTSDSGASAVHAHCVERRRECAEVPAMIDRNQEHSLTAWRWQECHCAERKSEQRDRLFRDRELSRNAQTKAGASCTAALNRSVATCTAKGVRPRRVAGRTVSSKLRG